MCNDLKDCKCSKKSEKNSMLCVISTSLFTLIFLAFIWLFVEKGGENYQYIKNIQTNETTTLVNGETFKYDNIDSINIKIDDRNLIIKETDGDLVEITSTIKNSGIIVTQPIVWVKNNTLYYNQGIKNPGVSRDVRLSNSEGELIVGVPKNLKLNFDIDNDYGDVFFEIEEANNLDLDGYSGEIEVLTKFQNLDIYSYKGEVDILVASENANINTKKGNVSMVEDEFTNKINFNSKHGNLNLYSENRS